MCNFHSIIGHNRDKNEQPMQTKPNPFTHPINSGE